MPKISVIIPVYNGEKTVMRSARSVLEQTFTDFEVIIVNDGSTDNTAEILQEIHDSRIKVITARNGGQGYARNIGIDEAKGEYLAFLDADDTIDRDMLYKMHSAAEKENADVVQCNLFDIYPNGEKRVQLPTFGGTVAITDRGEYTDRFFTPCIHSYEVCNKLIKKNAVGDLRFRDTRKYFSEDLMFNLELIERIDKITFLSEPLYNYYQNDTSHMHSGSEKRLTGLQLLFREYISGASEVMRTAAAYTAAMILSYSAAPCAKTETARGMLESDEFKGYIKTALTRKCRKNHRIFLTAMRISPVWGKIKLCQMYGRRWRT